MFGFIRDYQHLLLDPRIWSLYITAAGMLTMILAQ